ncbi:MAG TPA: heparan-alpha-glucosaminide N-acetyltransferase domain-containing protein [Gemmatimonadales bacterium]
MTSPHAAWAAPRPDPDHPRERVRGLDILRGMVILLMVIDHVRWFLSEARFDPTDPGQTTAALFFTRWITHFCAPVFMLLAGAGAYLSLGRGRSRTSLSWYLLSRGLWLLLLEVTFARLGWQFNLDYGYTGALVFWALGWSMIVLAGLVRLPRGVVAVLSVGMIAGHNLLDPIEAASWGTWSWLWMVLHEPGTIALAQGVDLFVLYPLVPWIGVMAAGYVFAPVMTWPAERRDPVLLRLGLGITASFLILRIVNAYGDPDPWSSQAEWWRTVLSFLDTTKYPASLLFLLMTLGPAIALLPRLERARGTLAEAVRTVGRVPLFFWLLHVPLIHAIAVGFSLARYGEVVPWLVRNPPTPLPDDYGYGLPVVYAVTLAVILLLYPACVWYAGLKRRRRDAWLGYL